jgi:cytochrome b561
MMQDTGRYHRAIVLLHWLMALCFLMMLASGFAMAEDDLLEKSLRFQVFQWHKSLGVLLLVAVAARVFLRLVTRAPALPAAFKPWEKLAAAAGHLGLYAAMLFMPLSGWAMASSSPYGLPTIVFGLFEWPHIPGIAANAAVSDAAKDVHEILAIAFLLLIGAHVGAVIKHFVLDKINLLPRMSWKKSA